ncbi:MAG: F0F1 ATP synthase subunit B [Paracoccaceae bacterium]
MKNFAIVAALLAASPAAAASGPFLSLGNTNFVVLLSFLLFLAILAYFKVPGMIAGLLDKRAEDITSDLNEARVLREEAQTLLASYERKQKEVSAQADRIVAHAKEEARLAGIEANEELKKSIARRLAAAEEQIVSAQKGAIKEVRDTAIKVAINAARDVIAKQMTATDANKLIDESIKTVGAKLH